MLEKRKLLSPWLNHKVPGKNTDWSGRIPLPAPCGRRDGARYYDWQLNYLLQEVGERLLLAEEGKGSLTEATCVHVAPLPPNTLLTAPPSTCCTLQSPPWIPWGARDASGSGQVGVAAPCIVHEVYKGSRLWPPWLLNTQKPPSKLLLMSEENEGLGLAL